ncbi:MAG: FAD-dependent oxidoreductase [Vicinamibacteria bacterium]|nr:FAD-dependent oxidoreductase [Vicinamibacteria bacterium]
MESYDFIVVGAGTAGLPCAIFGARAGARVLVVEKESVIGGTLHVSGGHMSAAGTRRQQERGIQDSTEAHFKDIQRISKNTAREDLVHLALAHAAGFVDWLQSEGFEFAPDSPRFVYGHEPYSVPRTHYGIDEARSVLKVLSRVAQPLIDSGAITLVLKAKVKALLTDHGRVVGVQFARDGQIRTARAQRGVVLATGGFASAPELFKEIEGFPLVSAAREHSTGDGLVLARGLGAHIAGRGAYLPTFGGLPHPTDPHRTIWTDRPLLIAKERPPYEIYVDRFGKRWIAEDDESIDRKERALLKTDGLTFFTVFDDHAVEMSPNIVIGWSKSDLRERAGRRAGVHAAPTLAELARAAGIDEEGLQVSVARYNGFVRDRVDADFGRTFLPAPIEKPPFYAMRNHGISLITFAGVDVDGSLRVRREDGSTIEGLYAAGEILGAGATCGNSFCGGMVMGPAMIFGKLIGERLAIPDDVVNGPTAEVLRPEGDVTRTAETERPQDLGEIPTGEIPRPKF